MAGARLLAVFAGIGIFTSGAAELELWLTVGMETLRAGWKIVRDALRLSGKSAQAIEEGICGEQRAP